METKRAFENYDALIEAIDPLLDGCYEFAGISREDLPVIYIALQNDVFPLYYSLLDKNLQVNLTKYTAADFSSEAVRRDFVRDVFVELRTHFQHRFLEEKYGAGMTRNLLLRYITLDEDSKETNLLEEDGLKTAQAWAEMYFAGKKLGTWQEQKAELEQLITADALLAIIQKCFE